MPGDVPRAGPREPPPAAGECRVAGWRGCAIAPAGDSGRRTRGPQTAFAAGRAWLARGNREVAV